MFGGKGDRLAEPQFVGLETAVFLLPAFAFVGQQNHRFVRAAQNVGKVFVIRLQTGARIIEKQTYVGLVNGFFGLFPHPRFQVVFVGILVSGGINDDKRQVV